MSACTCGKLSTLSYKDHLTSCPVYSHGIELTLSDIDEIKCGFMELKTLPWAILSLDQKLELVINDKDLRHLANYIYSSWINSKREIFNLPLEFDLPTIKMTKDNK